MGPFQEQISVVLSTLQENCSKSEQRNLILCIRWRRRSGDNTNLKSLPYTRVKHIHERDCSFTKFRTLFSTKQFKNISILSAKKSLRRKTSDTMLPQKTKSVLTVQSISVDKIKAIRSLYHHFSPTDTKFWGCLFRENNARKYRGPTKKKGRIIKIKTVEESSVVDK